MHLQGSQSVRYRSTSSADDDDSMDGLEQEAQLKGGPREVLIRPLTPPDRHDLEAAEGWPGLGNPVEAEKELDSSRRHPSKKAVTWCPNSLDKIDF